MKLLFWGFAACALTVPGIVKADNKAETVSSGSRVELKKVLKAEGDDRTAFCQ